MGGGPRGYEDGSMILVDSSVWIDYFNGLSTWQTELLDNYLSNTLVIIGDLILAEVLQGFTSDNDYETIKDLLGALPFRQIGGYGVAVQSAQNYRALKKSGVTIRNAINVVIGTFCIMEGLSLLHDDRDFDPMVSYFNLKTSSP